MATSTHETMAERRRYFRIEDEIILSFHPVDADAVPETDTFREVGPNVFDLAAHLEILNWESSTMLRKIEREDPLLGDYLRLLEQKVDLIARCLVAHDDELCQQPARQVNLSASGLSFSADCSFSAGDVLELRLVLPPSLIGIHAYGRIVYCRREMLHDDSAHRIGVDFIGLRDQDRDLLIRHIVKKESQQLREHRQVTSSPGF